MPALASHSNNLSGLEPWQERFGHGAATKALTLMLQGRIYEEMRVRRAARKHVRAFLGLSFPEQQRILAGSNVFVFRGGALRRGGG